jgi:hypothetical protein
MAYTTTQDTIKAARKLISVSTARSQRHQHSVPCFSEGRILTAAAALLHRGLATESVNRPNRHDGIAARGCGMPHGVSLTRVSTRLVTILVSGIHLHTRVRCAGRQRVVRLPCRWRPPWPSRSCAPRARDEGDKALPYSLWLGPAAQDATVGLPTAPHLPRLTGRVGRRCPKVRVRDVGGRHRPDQHTEL